MNSKPAALNKLNLKIVSLAKGLLILAIAFLIIQKAMASEVRGAQPFLINKCLSDRFYGRDHNQGERLNGKFIDFRS